MFHFSAPAMLKHNKRISINTTEGSFVRVSVKRVMTEKDIAMHTLLVRNLPRDANANIAERELSRVFTETNVMGVRVIG